MLSRAIVKEIASMRMEVMKDKGEEIRVEISDVIREMIREERSEKIDGGRRVVFRVGSILPIISSILS